MEPITGAIQDLERNGFAIARAVIDRATQEELLSALPPVAAAGRRGMLREPAAQSLARSEKILVLLRPHLPAEPQPVRAIYFDKTAEANWKVAWHQDLTLALRERAEVRGFGPWSVKDGVPHAQASAHLLDQMLTLRLHLDDADASNGALRVLPGSHRHGRLSVAQTQAMRADTPDVLCTAAAGDVLLMRPLLLHASSHSTSPRRRRILHIEYAGFALPSPLAWHESDPGEARS
jgi:hypothetical protein